MGECIGCAKEHTKRLGSDCLNCSRNPFSAEPRKDMYRDCDFINEKECKDCLAFENHFPNGFPCSSCNGRHLWCHKPEHHVAKKPNDNVNHPEHYTAGKVECIDAIEAAVTGLEGIEAVCTAQVLKYMWRWKRKNGIEDLKKARWYLDRLIGGVE